MSYRWETYEVEQLPSNILNDPQSITIIEKEILSLENIYEKDSALFSLVKKLISENILDTAERITRSTQEWGLEKMHFFSDIALNLKTLGQTEHGLRLLHESVVLARNIDNGWQKAEIFSKIAECFAKFGEGEIATQLWIEAASIAIRSQDDLIQDAMGAQDALDALSVLKEVVNHLALNGELSKARRLANNVKYGRETVIEHVEKIASTKGISK